MNCIKINDSLLAEIVNDILMKKDITSKHVKEKTYLPY